MWYFRSPEIVFGEEALSRLEQLEGKRAYIVTDANVAQLGFVERVRQRLDVAGIESEVFAEVEPDPSLQTVLRCAAAMADWRPDWVIGLGGGSSMDTAKAAWLLYERPDVDPAAINPFESYGLRRKARLITIPTTSGSGSEATWAVVLTDTEAHRKLGLGAPELMADIAIVDPAFTLELPPRVTADSGMDVLTHAIEGFTSNWHNDFTDGLCLKAIQLVFTYLARVYKDGSDREAREHMHNAAAIGGLAFGNSMAALAHAMGHSLGALFKVPHGRAVSLFLPYTIEFSANQGLTRYSEIARFLHLPASDEREAAASLCAAIRELQRTIDQPLAIRDLGIAPDLFRDAIPQLVANAETDTQLVMSSRIPESDELRRLFEYSYEGRSIDF